MYALAQNKGNRKSMADAIRSIPYHAFNYHSKCGMWCGYLHDDVNYDHKIVHEVSNDQRLFEEVKDIFSENSFTYRETFMQCLNATMASKAPKSQCYSMTASADFRFTCTVGRKNICEGYAQETANAISLSPGEHHSRHVSRAKKVLCKKMITDEDSCILKRLLELKKNSKWFTSSQRKYRRYYL
jgi:hypothetical protein